MPTLDPLRIGDSPTDIETPLNLQDGVIYSVENVGQCALKFAQRATAPEATFRTHVLGPGKHEPFSIEAGTTTYMWTYAAEQHSWISVTEAVG